MDAELILLADALWQELGLKDVQLEINSLGEPDERKAHRAALIAYLEGNVGLLDEEAKRNCIAILCVFWIRKILICKHW